MRGWQLFLIRHWCTEELDVSVLKSLGEVQLCFRSLEQLLPTASACWFCALFDRSSVVMGVC